jgi:putative component of membrane protein insertase Oxa1/YidC/SpoIIIJ protein YidD
MKKSFYKTSDLPSQFEQDVVECYVCYRELNRPNFTIALLLKYVILILILNCFFSLILWGLLEYFSCCYLTQYKLLHNINEFPLLTFCIIYIVLLALGVLFFLKEIVIASVRLYQRYAPEEIRRRCLFKPTCSEYTIISLRKYGLFIGLYLAYSRIFKRCRGNIYRIDYP